MLSAALRRVASNPAMLRLEGSWLTAWAAEGAYIVSLLVFAYEIGGVVAVGLITMLRSLPSGLLAPVLTALVDRFAPARVLLAVHLGRAAAIGVVALAAALDLPPGLAVSAAAIEGLLIGLHRATTLGFMPALARSPEELLAGNSVISLGEGTGSMLGPVVAGLLLLLGGPELGLALAAAGYGAAALIIASIHVSGAHRPPATTGNAPGAGARLHDMLGGFAALKRHRAAGLLIGLFGGQTFVRGALTVLIVAIAVELLDIGQSGVGYLTSAFGAGGLVGAFLAMTVIAGRGLATPFAVSLALWGLPILVIGLLPNAIVAFVLLGMVGAANASLDVSGFTLLQRTVPNDVRRRVFGALESVAAIGIAGGAAMAPAVIEVAGLQAALIFFGAVLPVLALVTYPLVRRADDAAIVPQRELALLRGIPMFAPLSMTIIEQLARDLEPVGFGAGEHVITQGEPGNCFYVIARGSVEIVHDGELVRVLGAGDGFGEIALLSERPRTASVVVRDPMEGYRLLRPAFLEAVTGSPHAVTAGDALVSRRLAELGHDPTHPHGH